MKADMNLLRIYAIFVRQIFLIRHNPIRFINLFLWVGIDIVLWGFITKYLDSLGSSKFSFFAVVFSAVMLWEFLIRAQSSVMMGFFEDMWSQNFINYFSSPLKIKEYLGGLIFSGFVNSIIGLLVIIIIAGLIFGFNLFTIGIFILPSLIILFIFAISLGFFASGIVFRFGPSAEWIAWPLPFLFGPLSGVFYPISALPHFLQIIAKFFPSVLRI